MRQTPYSAALVDIRLPDLDGYETYKRLREVQPDVPIILMTGFGWDPSHSIVKARQEGLQTVLYKPFRADRLMEAVEQALRTSPAAPRRRARAPRRPRDRAPTSPDGRPARRPTRRPAAPRRRRRRIPDPSRPRVMSLDWPWLAVVVARPCPRDSAISATSSWRSTSSAAWDIARRCWTGSGSCSSPRSGSRRPCCSGGTCMPPGGPGRWPLRGYAVALRGLGPGDLADLDAGPGPAAAARGDRARRAVRELDLAEPEGRDALIGDGHGRLAAPAPGQRVVPPPPARVGRGDPRPARGRSTACGSSSSPTCTSPLASTARSSSGWSTPAAAGRPTWSSSPATWSRTTRRSTGSSRCSRRWRPGWASSRSSATTTTTTSRGDRRASWPAPASRRWKGAGRRSRPTARRSPSAGRPRPGGRRRPGRDADGRLPDPAQPLPRPLLPGRGVGDRPDALGPQPRRPDPAAAGRRRLHAEPLLAAVRPRLLPPRPDADVRQPGHRRQAPGPLRLPARDHPARPPRPGRGRRRDASRPHGRRSTDPTRP